MCECGLPYRTSEGRSDQRLQGLWRDRDFSSGSTYTPGVPVTISVSVTDPIYPTYGFQMTARLESNLSGGQAGDFTAGASQIVICDAPDGVFKGPKGCPASEQVQFIEHYFDMGKHPNTTPYTFTWTPPAANVGNIHFYVAGNAVNDNGDFSPRTDAGDHVYTNSYVLTFAAAGPPPSIFPGGVLNSASYAKDSQGNGSPVAPGSLVQIYGTNFGSSPAHAAAVPLSSAALGGVSVTFNNIPAPMLDVSPTGAYPSIVAQMPSGLPSESTNVSAVVMVNGVASPPQSIPIMPAAPGIFSFPVGAGNAIAINFADRSLAAPAGSIPGIAAHPAKVGDTIIILATGLGVMTPAVPDGAGGGGVTASTANLKPVVLVGGITADVDFAGQSPGFPGVNQINIKIPPKVQTGNAVPLQIQSGSVTSTDAVTIAIQ